MTDHPALEQRLTLLSAGTAERREAAAAEIAHLAALADWRMLASQLRERRLLPMLGPRLLELAGDRAGRAFADEVSQALEHSRRQGAFLLLIAERVQGALTEAGLRCAVLKGAPLSQQLYGDPGRRPSGDIDLLVAPEQLAGAVEVVRGLGYGPPADHLDQDGLPRLHLTLTHERDQLPPVEIHWRIHWYERSFAVDRLLAPVPDPAWRPAPIDEIAAMLLFYARDGFLDLRHVTDLGAYWDAHAQELAPGALDETIRSYPALEHVLLAGATIASRTAGLPLERLTARGGSLRTRDRVAVRLTEPHLYASEPQLYASMALIDGLLAPAGGLRGFVRRQVIPPREVLEEQAKKAGLPKVSSPLGHGVRVLGRYALALARLRRPSRAFDPLAAGQAQARPLRLAYLCSQYPAVSHTFVLREVEALRALGAQIDTFSIRRAGAEQLLARADEEAFRTTYAILPPRWGALLMAHMRLLAGAPSAYLSGLAEAMRLAAPGVRGALWQVFYFAESVDLWRQCSRRGIRHIHVHMANVAADVALLAAHIGTTADPSRPWSWSYTQHGPREFEDLMHFRLAEKVSRALFVVCISDYARSQLMSVSDPDIWERLHVVHVGIPIAQFTRVQGQTRPAGHPMILFIGRQVSKKGQGVLLEAIELLERRGRIVDATLAGSGPAMESLEALAQRLGIGARVSFPGAVGQDDIHDLYARASIFCLPSFAEGVPGVLMEAMAMELPCVTTQIAGIPELIRNGENGVLVTPGRADELADALERLLEDPQLCSEIGARGREKVVRDFNTETTARQLYELFAAQLAGRL